MGKKFTLAGIKDESEKKFGGTDVEYADGKVFTLRNVLRLTDAEQDEYAEREREVNDVINEKNADGSEKVAGTAKMNALVDGFREQIALLVVAADREVAKQVVAELDDADVLTLLTMHNEQDAAGEA